MSKASNQLIQVGGQIVTAPAPSKLRRATYIISASLFWLYFLVNTFAFSIDGWLKDALGPDLQWLVTYKLLLVAIIVAAAARYASRASVLRFVAVFLFFPIILLFWIALSIVKTRNANLMIAAVNLTAFLLSDFRAKSLQFVLFCFAVVPIAFSESRVAAALSLTASIVLLLAIHFRAVRAAFIPGSTAKLYGRLIDFFGNHSDKFLSRDEPKYDPAKESAVAANDTADEPGKETAVVTPSGTLIDGVRKTQVELVLSLNRGLLYVASKFRDYQESVWRYVPALLMPLLLLLGNVLLFALASRALCRLDSDQFRIGISAIGFFDYIYYSANNLVFNHVPQVVAVGDAARWLQLAQVFFSFLLGVIFVSSIFSQYHARIGKDIDDVISQLKRGASGIEAHFSTEYGYVNAHAMMRDLALAGSKIAEWLEQATRDLEP